MLVYEENEYEIESNDFAGWRESWEAEEAKRRAEQWDTRPADLNVEIEAWVAEYRLRLHKTTLAGRNRTRDKEMLKTLCWLMEQQETRTFVASRRELSEHSGLYPDATFNAVKSLREAGYLCAWVLRNSTTPTAMYTATHL